MIYILEGKNNDEECFWDCFFLRESRLISLNLKKESWFFPPFPTHTPTFSIEKISSFFPYSFASSPHHQLNVIPFRVMLRSQSISITLLHQLLDFHSNASGIEALVGDLFATITGQPEDRAEVQSLTLSLHIPL